MTKESLRGQTGPDESRSARPTAVIMGVIAMVLWAVLGPDNPLVATALTLCTANLGMVVIPLALRIPRRWYRVPRAERLLHLVLGVPVFGWLLDISGWNRHVALPMRKLTISRASLPRLLLNIHAAEGAHAIAFVPHVVLSAVAVAMGYPDAVLWLLLPGVLMHL